MTTGRKIVFTLGFAALLGTAVYEGRIVAQLQAGVRDLQQQTHQLAGELSSLRAASGPTIPADGLASNETAALDAASPPPPPASDENPALIRLRQLKQFLADTPSQQIPELQLLSNLDWLAVVQERNPGPTPARLRPNELRFMAERLRFQAKEKFARTLWTALDRYKREHDGLLPSDLAQLTPSFESPPDPAILRRYEVLRSGPAADLSRNDRILVEKSLADEWYDRRLYFTAFVAWDWDPPANTLSSITTAATWEFAKANQRKPANAADILPYLKDDEKKYYDLTTLQRFWASPLRRDPLPQVGERDTIRVSEDADGVPKAEIVNRP